jgi:Tol biopolymer transport system component
MEGGDELDLYLMDANGQNGRQISGRPGDEHAPSWSPDGQAIAFKRLDWSKQRNDKERYTLHIQESRRPDQKNLDLS